MSGGRHEGRGVFVSGGTTGMGLAAAGGVEEARASTSSAARRRSSTRRWPSWASVRRAGRQTCPSRARSRLRSTQALRFVGRLDAVFVNAGIDGQNRGCLEIDADFFRYVIDVNCVGSFLVARGAARRMPDGGAIIFNASISGLASEEGFADYSASKGGQILLARTMAKELGRRLLGADRLPRVRAHPAGRQVPRRSGDRGDIVSHIPIGRVGTAEEIARLVSFLAEPEAAYLNGAIINVDGGRMA